MSRADNIKHAKDFISIDHEYVKRAINKYGYNSGFKYYRLGIPYNLFQRR